MGVYVGHIHRPLRAVRVCRHPSAEAPHRTRGDPGRRLELHAQLPEAAPLRRGPQDASLRVLRPGRVVAGSANELDPRPHQRRARRQPAREPPHPLSQLRGDVAHALLAHLPKKVCPTCGEEFRKGGRRQRFCSQRCWQRSPECSAAKARAGRRKVEWPSYEQLLTDLREMPWVAVGVKYGVSDNAVRKWMRRYEAERSQISRPAA